MHSTQNIEQDHLAYLSSTIWSSLFLGKAFKTVIIQAQPKINIQVVKPVTVSFENVPCAGFAVLIYFATGVRAREVSCFAKGARVQVRVLKRSQHHFRGAFVHCPESTLSP